MKKIMLITAVAALMIIGIFYYLPINNSNSTDPVRQAAVGKYCPGSLITFNKSEKDETGFFSVTFSAGGGRPTDRPVSFFDAEGGSLGAFHIFGDEKENQKVMEVVNELQKKFPIVEQVDCGE